MNNEDKNEHFVGIRAMFARVRCFFALRFFFLELFSLSRWLPIA